MSDMSILRYEKLPQTSPQVQNQKVSFTWGRRSKKVSGILKLAQLVIKTMLTTRGTDLERPDLGTLIPNLIRRGVTRSTLETMRLDITISIEDLERQVVDIQSGVTLPASERLSELEVLRIEYVTETNEWQIDVRVISEAGESVSIDIAPFLVGN